MLGGNFSLGIVFSGKGKGRGVTSGKLALLVLFVSVKNFCITEASLAALVNMYITDSCPGTLYT